MNQLINDILIYGLVSNTILVLIGLFLAWVTVYAVRQMKTCSYDAEGGYFVVALVSGVLAVGLIGIQGSELLKLLLTPALYLFEHTQGYAS